MSVTAMKRVVRVLVYEGPDEWVDKTLERSLPANTKYTLGPDTSITSLQADVVDLPLWITEQAKLKVIEGGWPGKRNMEHDNL